MPKRKRPFEEPRPSDRFGEDTRRILEGAHKKFAREMKLAQQNLHGAMDVAREEIERARREFDSHMRRIQAELERATGQARADLLPPGSRTGDQWGGWIDRLSKRRRPGRKPPGGEPVPVEPRPKPKPLMDGAEAPIE